MTNTKARLNRIRREQLKSQDKLEKARTERIWIEENEYIHILNYPYYKFKRWLEKEK